MEPKQDQIAAMMKQKRATTALIGKREAAAILGTTVYTLTRWLRANPNLLPGRVKVGKTRYKWRRVAVEAFARAADFADPVSTTPAQT